MDIFKLTKDKNTAFSFLGGNLRIWVCLSWWAFAQRPPWCCQQLLHKAWAAAYFFHIVMISCCRVAGESSTIPPPLENSGSQLSSELLNSCKSPQQAWVYSFHLWGVSTLMAVINWLGAGVEDSFVNWGQVSKSCYPGWPPHLGSLWGHLPPIIRAAEPIDTAWLPLLVGGTKPSIYWLERRDEYNEALRPGLAQTAAQAKGFRKNVFLFRMCMFWLNLKKSMRWFPLWKTN